MGRGLGILLIAGCGSSSSRKTRSLRGRGLGILLIAGCGGGGDEPVAGDVASGGEETSAQVRIDPPEEGTLVVLDPSGRIGFQTNVRMEIESTPGTSLADTQRFGAAVQRRMPDVRTCYDRAVATDPEIEGSLRLVVETDARGRVRSEVAESGLEQGRVTTCVLAILRRLPRADVPGSARVNVVLTASNTMAEGTRSVREHREQGGEP